jgi:hypothetical protein
VPWEPRRAFWADRAANENTLRENLLSLQAARTRHVGTDPNVERYDPDLWTDEFAFLSQPVQADIQSDLFYDYRTNVVAYPKWRAWLRYSQPRLLVIWGKYDASFDISEPEAYRRDLPGAQVHVLDAGHFALDTAAAEIAALIRGFVAASRSRSDSKLAKANPPVSSLQRLDFNDGRAVVASHPEADRRRAVVNEDPPDVGRARQQVIDHLAGSGVQPRDLVRYHRPGPGILVLVEHDIVRR